MRATASACYIFAVAALLVCLAESAPTESSGQPDALGAERVCVEQLGISLSLPAGWDIQTLEGPAVRLVPSSEAQRQLAALRGVVGREIKLWPIEIVAWTSPAPSHSPQQAVAGHEQLLKQRYNYQRDTIESFATTFGLPGVAVTGRIGSGEDALLVVFAGYTVSDHSIVVGTFCHPTDREVIARLFQPLIRSVGPARAANGGTSSPVAPPSASPRTDRPETSASIEHPQTVTELPQPVSPSTSVGPERTGAPPQPLSLPQTGREPSIPTALRLPEPSTAAQQPVAEAPSEASTVHPPPQTEPISVPSPPPQVEPGPATAPAEQVMPGRWVEHVLPAGITLRTPAGWSATVGSGIFHAYGPEGTEGIMVCPLFDIPSIVDLSPSADRDADIICQYWQQLAGHSFTASSHLAIQRSGQVFDVFSGTLALGDDTARAIVTIAADQPIILLIAAYAPPEQFERRLPTLQKILTGLSLPRLAPTIPGQLSKMTINWTSPDGGLTGQVPEGWQMQATLSQYNGHTVITVDGRCAGQARSHFAWRQPYTPFFRELTPLLRGLGRLPGEKYRDRPQETALTILSKLSPVEFVSRKLLDDIGLDPQDIETRRTRPYQAIGTLLEGRNQAGTIVELKGRTSSGSVTAKYLLATADLPIIEGSFRWRAAYLMWSGADSSIWAARRALGTVLATTRAAGPASAGGDLPQMLEAARNAFSDAVPQYTYELAPLLSGVFQPQAAGPVVVPKLLWAYWTDSE